MNRLFFLHFFLETSYDDTPRPLSEQSHSNFLQSFSQRIYLSYRKQFEPFHILARNGDSISSDCGWGCMIRCAQMLLAQTLLLHMTSTIHLPYSNIQMSDKCKFLYLCFFFWFLFECIKKVQNEIQLNVFEIRIASIVEFRFTRISFVYLAIIQI